MDRFNKLLILGFQLFVISVYNLNAQTQGQQEEKWAKDLFNKNTKSHDYPKFTGQIIRLDSNSFKFDEKTLAVDNPSDGLKYLLINGIFYPNMIVGNEIAVIKTKQELDTLSDSQKMFYNMSRTDSLRISDFEEIKSLSKSPKQKRYKFYLYRLGIINPTIYYIELINENATKELNQFDFMKESKVTFIKKGSVLL